ncbi:hypothetical protein G9A89_004263 [Geosiphon pyriformis]|nr:hypothetical protein G9A89_004263 [Geosiphon pyriformis]
MPMSDVLDIDLGLGVGILGLMSSILAEMQTIALALECIPPFSSVHLFSDSQSALDACKSELGLVKNLRVSWLKVKDHFDVLENEHANALANAVSLSKQYFPLHLNEHFLVANSYLVFSNSRHFVRDVFCSICYVYWEVSSGSTFLDGNLYSNIDWISFLLVWHPNLHMVTGFTDKLIAFACTYFMKVLHCQLPIAIYKQLYN